MTDKIKTKKELEEMEFKSEARGCFVLGLIIFIVIAAVFYRADQQAMTSMKKLDYCTDHKLTAQQCRDMYEVIPVNPDKKGR